MAEYIAGIDSLRPIPAPVFEKCVELLKTYFIVGGMPEPVSAWLDTKDVGLTEKIQKEILAAYFDRIEDSRSMPNSIQTIDRGGREMNNTAGKRTDKPMDSPTAEKEPTAFEPPRIATIGGEAIRAEIGPAQMCSPSPCPLAP